MPAIGEVGTVPSRKRRRRRPNPLGEAVLAAVEQAARQAPPTIFPSGGRLGPIHLAPPAAPTVTPAVAPRLPVGGGIGLGDIVGAVSDALNTPLPNVPDFLPGPEISNPATGTPVLHQERAAPTVGSAAALIAAALAPEVAPESVAAGLRFIGRHPLVAGPVAAETPSAIVSGDPRQLGKAFSGTGVAADVLGGIAGGVRGVGGVPGNALADLISLPAQVLPSLYLLGAGGVEAAQGRPERLNQMWDYYKSVDPLPALLSGHPGEALQRFGEHPVYSALELAGIKAAAGGVAGRVLRTPSGVERPPLHVGGGHPTGEGSLAPVADSLRQIRGTYSRDPLTAALQKRADLQRLERRPGPNVVGATGQTIRSIQATARQAQRTVRRAGIAEVAAHRGVQVATREEIARVMEQVKPARHSADTVQLMVQRALVTPETAMGDLRNFRDLLAGARNTLDSRAKLDANQRSLDTIDAALKNPDVEGIARATDAFLRIQRPQEREMIRLGLLAEDQARKAPLFNFARTHMGAEHGQLPEVTARIRELEAQRIPDGGPGLSREQLNELQRLRNTSPELLHQGKPLSTAEIEAEMRARGVPVNGGRPEAGYVSGRPGGADRPGSYWRGYEQRPQLARKALTGEAASKGTAELTWENLVGTLQHAATTIGATAAFDRFGKMFGIGIHDPAGVPQPFKDRETVLSAIEHPSDYGITLPPMRGGYGVWQTGHMMSLARELEAARRGGPEAGLKVEADPALQEQGLMEAAIQRATAAADPKGDFYIMPNEIIDLLKHSFAPVMPIERALQAGTGWLKRAWLPTNPGWLGGNIVDNYPIRTFGTGLGIGDIRGGQRVGGMAREGQGVEGQLASERMTPGALFASVSKVQPKRLAESFAGDRLFGDVARLGATVARTLGVRHALHAFDRYSKAVFNFEHKYIERLPQYAELNRAARTMVGQTRGEWRRALKAQTPAVRDLVEHGLRDTSYQRYFGERVAATYGNWTRMSPGARRFLSSVAPFWTWARAATKFVFATMPREHPVITGILAAAGQMTREERAKFGLDLQAEVPMPGWLQGSLPAKFPGLPGDTVKLSNLSSYGFFANFPENYATSFFPQGENVVQNLKGLAWNGRQLVDGSGKPAGPWQRVLTAATTIGSSFIPFYNAAHSGITKGPSGLLPFQTYPKSLTDYLRNKQNQQQIGVPIPGVPQLPSNPSGSSGGAFDWGSSQNPAPTFDWGSQDTTTPTFNWGG